MPYITQAQQVDKDNPLEINISMYGGIFGKLPFTDAFPLQKESEIIGSGNLYLAPSFNLYLLKNIHAHVQYDIPGNAVNVPLGYCFDNGIDVYGSYIKSTLSYEEQYFGIGIEKIIKLPKIPKYESLVGVEGDYNRITKHSAISFFILINANIFNFN
ncbi:MAG: hypothetical protein NTW62_00425 [Candidatus Nomurabacteria bacterium]|nr:hypothetical protein [Candidatus Nomurabacteria bacterium]